MEKHPINTSNQPTSASRQLPPVLLIVSLFSLLFILLMVIFGWIALGRLKQTNAFHRSIDTSSYQAVFITNGQAYFGKLSTISSTGYKLSDVYYYQVQNTNQQPDLSQPSNNQDQNLSLAKLGSELHGPQDAMYIESKQVLFWENLKSDSRVVQAIKKYHQNK